jgi:hypothetical protein
MTPVLAHQGGWDEILYLVVPVILVVLWVRWAERRSRVRRGADEDAANLPADRDPH